MQELRKKYPTSHQVYLIDDKEVDANLYYIELEEKKRGSPIP
jgi:hypothetical protein